MSHNDNGNPYQLAYLTTSNALAFRRITKDSRYASFYSFELTQDTSTTILSVLKSDSFEAKLAIAYACGILDSFQD